MVDPGTRPLLRDEIELVRRIGAAIAEHRALIVHAAAPVQDDHETEAGIYVTHEAQLRELVAHMRRHDRRLARAIVTALSAPPRTLDAFGTVLAFVARQARRERRAR